MSYSYHVERPKLFTEAGMTSFLKLRDRVHSMLNESGAVMFDNVPLSGDSWFKLACFDYMVERGEILELIWPDRYHPPMAQHRVYVKKTY
jgi:hypothetical protein